MSAMSRVRSFTYGDDDVANYMGPLTVHLTALLIEGYKYQ